jgi:hypothetical protein
MVRLEPNGREFRSGHALSAGMIKGMIATELAAAQSEQSHQRDHCLRIVVQWRSDPSSTAGSHQESTLLEAQNSPPHEIALTRQVVSTNTSNSAQFVFGHVLCVEGDVLAGGAREIREGVTDVTGFDGAVRTVQLYQERYTEDIQTVNE